MIAGFSFLGGTLLGFLFGVPRTVETETRASEKDTIPTPPAEGVHTGAGTNNLPQYQVNTNLEQISDWLTKILVGVGLTQLTQLPSQLTRVARYFGSSINPGTSGGSGSFAVTIILSFSVLGFLFGYVATRVFLAPMFRLADSKLYNALEQVSENVKAKEKEAETLSTDIQRLAKQRRGQEASGEIVALLWDYDNRDFDEAIDKAEKTIAQIGEPQDVWFWIWTTLAYGQRFNWYKDHPQEFSSEQSEETRRKVLEAMDKALALNSDTAKREFRRYSQPDPQKPPDFDDLEILHGDADFARRIV